MNKIDLDILLAVYESKKNNQRELAKKTGYSLGAVNKSVNYLCEEGLIDKKLAVTDTGKELIKSRRPKNAVILAAGFGMRMVPINMETPKALITVKGEVLIERLIKQLKEVGIEKIYVVVGFMKDSFEYLIDKYGVNLIYNPDYASKNSLFSLMCASRYVSNSYILPSDIYCEDNPFSKNELYSWYLVTDKNDDESKVRVNRRQEIVRSEKANQSNRLVGISYLTKEDSADFLKNAVSLSKNPEADDKFWEAAFYTDKKITVYAHVAPDERVYEINTYEQLRNIDSDSNHLKSKSIKIAADALSADMNEIVNITVLKTGMTNRSFLFMCRGKKYIMRIPGEGTDKLINRREEAEVYGVINGKDICDRIIYIDPENGYKITEYMDNARVCDPLSQSDIQRCMDYLRAFHEKKLKVSHEFDIFGQTEFYETLWEGDKSIFRDYEETKRNVFSLKNFIDENKEPFSLTHVDAVPDNFLFTPDGKGGEEIHMIDWEYAGMQDPHLDIAMFCIYSLYDRDQVENLIDTYFKEGCPKKTRIKIYCYIAACGLLWSNWCEYKRKFGVEFGEYSLRQYRFAKDYYKIAVEAMKDES